MLPCSAAAKYQYFGTVYLADSALACRRDGGSALADGHARDQVGFYFATHAVSDAKAESAR
jgi:hypothetical protein